MPFRSTAGERVGWMIHCVGFVPNLRMPRWSSISAEIRKSFSCSPGLLSYHCKSNSDIVPVWNTSRMQVDTSECFMVILRPLFLAICPLHVHHDWESERQWICPNSASLHREIITPQWWTYWHWAHSKSCPQLYVASFTTHLWSYTTHATAYVYTFLQNTHMHIFSEFNIGMPICTYHIIRMYDMIWEMSFCEACCLRRSIEAMWEDSLGDWVTLKSSQIVYREMALRYT